MKTITVKITGTAPLLQHNVQLADKLNKWAREISKISKKRSPSEDDLMELARLEFLGGAYVDAENRPLLPSTWVERAIVEGARKQKLGKQATSGVRVDKDALLSFAGPKDINKRAEDPACRLTCAVGIGQRRVMRTRPRFDDWSATVEVMIDPEVIDADVVVEALRVTGRNTGIGDYRPRYGRFTVEVV